MVHRLFIAIQNRQTVHSVNQCIHNNICIIRKLQEYIQPIIFLYGLIC